MPIQALIFDHDGVKRALDPEDLLNPETVPEK